MNQNQDPFKLSLSNFLAAGESNDPLQAPPNFHKVDAGRRVGGRTLRA